MDRGHLDALVDALVRAGNAIGTDWTADDEGTWSLTLRDPIDFGAIARLATRRPYRTVVFDPQHDLISCAHCWSQIHGARVHTEAPGERWDPEKESWIAYRSRR